MKQQNPAINRRIPWDEPKIETVDQAILYAVSYSDVFNYPLTVNEIHRYLVGIRISLDDVRSAVHRVVNDPASRITESAGFVMLRGREFLVDLRRRRTEIAAAMWPRALRYGAAIAHLPFVRMVAVTGALTMDHVEPDDDFDFLIVTVPGRVWVTRLLVIQLVVKPAAKLGDEVCPNFFLAETALQIAEQDLFRAHELAQMIPVYGMDVYRRLRSENAWSLRFLPNAADPPRVKSVPPQNGRIGRVLSEFVLKSPAGSVLDRREMARMQRKLGAREGFEEVVLSPERCKGHVGAHGHLTHDRFVARVDAIFPEGNDTQT